MRLPRLTLPRLLLTLLLALPGTLAGAARAATLTVTNTGDSGPGSLRAAIAQANTDGAGGAYDTIQFSLPANSVITVGSTLTITAPMTIIGAGAASLAIDGGNTGGNTNPNGVPVFTISGGTAGQPVALSSLTLQNGSALGFGTGGGVSVFSGAAALTDCVLTHDYSAAGGCVANAGTVSLTRCTFADSYGRLFGGGLFNGAGGVSTLTDCTFTNDDSSFGGGLANLGPDSFDNLPAGTVQLTGCTFSGNLGGVVSGEGGGIENEGTATLNHCTLVGNTSDSGLTSVAAGGGIHNTGQATLTDCAITGNSCDGQGGGLYNSGTATLVDCALTANFGVYDFSVSGFPFGGGGLCNTGTATLTGCLLSANTTGLRGGGLDNESGTATLTGCTLTGNSAYASGSQFINGGGALYVAGGAVTLTDDILYGDSSPVGEIQGTAAASHCDIQGDSPTPDASGNFGADPKFLSGGDLHLQPGSPCAGAGTTTAPGNSYLPFDLDGRPRPTPPYTNPSVGAYEAAPAGPYALVVENAGDGGLFNYKDVGGLTHYNLTYVLPRSLRAAVQCADDYAGATAAISFDPLVFTSRLTIPLTGGLGTLTLSQPMGITGPAPGVAIDGGYDHAAGSGGVRIFHVTAGTPADPVTLSGLTLQNGNAGTDANGGGGLLNSGAVVALTDCALVGDIAPSGGGLSNVAGGAATLTGCALVGDTATQGGSGGGGVFAFGPLTLTDCVFAGDSAAVGGGLLNNAGKATVTECTFSGNSASSGLGGGLANTATALLTDDILYGDTGGEIASPLGGVTTASYSDIGGGYAGTGNLSADPLFVNAPGDLRVTPGSPVVGAGTAVAPAYSPYDIAGRPRADPPTLGAYEGQKARTRTSLTSSLDPSVVGQSVTLTVTVADTSAPNGPVPTGTVTLSGLPGGARTLALDGSGQASVTTAALPAGTYTLTAAYTPGPGFLAGPATPPLTQTVLGIPTANPQTVGVAFNTAKAITLTGSDPNSPPRRLTYAVATPPAHGTLAGFSAVTGAVTYTPAAGYSGPDSFTFTVSNGPAASAPATVSVTVSQVAADVTGQVTVARGGYRYRRSDGHYFQAVTLTNTGAALADPVSLALDGLAGASLVNASGTTSATSPAGSPYVNLPAGGLAPGASETVVLEFTGLPRGYTPRVLAGPGLR